jgi:hypothetical protein
MVSPHLIDDVVGYDILADDREVTAVIDLLRFSWQAHYHGLFHTPFAA